MAGYNLVLSFGLLFSFCDAQCAHQFGCNRNARVDLSSLGLGIVNVPTHSNSQFPEINGIQVAPIGVPHAPVNGGSTSELLQQIQNIVGGDVVIPDTTNNGNFVPIVKPGETVIIGGDSCSSEKMQINSLKTEVRGLNIDVDNLESEIRELVSKVDQTTNQSTLSSTQLKLEAAENMNAQLSNSLANQATQINSLRAAIENSENSASATIKDLQTQIVNLRKALLVEQTENTHCKQELNSATSSNAHDEDMTRQIVELRTQLEHEKDGNDMQVKQLQQAFTQQMEKLKADLGSCFKELKKIEVVITTMDDEHKKELSRVADEHTIDDGHNKGDLVLTPAEQNALLDQVGKKMIRGLPRDLKQKVRKVQNEKVEIEHSDMGDVKVDKVCKKTMSLARKLPALAELLSNPGKDNEISMEEAIEQLTEECQELAKTDPLMQQCTFYLNTAKKFGDETLEKAWLMAFGDINEQMRGCGQVVTEVNEALLKDARVKNVVPAIIDGEDVFIDLSNNSRRLETAMAGITALGAGAATVLAYVCKSFDPTTFDLI